MRLEIPSGNTLEAVFWSRRLQKIQINYLVFVHTAKYLKPIHRFGFCVLSLVVRKQDGYTKLGELRQLICIKLLLRTTKTVHHKLLTLISLRPIFFFAKINLTDNCWVPVHLSMKDQGCLRSHLKFFFSHKTDMYILRDNCRINCKIIFILSVSEPVKNSALQTQQAFGLEKTDF